MNRWRFIEKNVCTIVRVGVHNLLQHEDFFIIVYLPAAPELGFAWVRIKPHASPHIEEHHCVHIQLRHISEIGSLLAHRLERRPNITAILSPYIVHAPASLDVTLHSTGRPLSLFCHCTTARCLTGKWDNSDGWCLRPIYLHNWIRWIRGHELKKISSYWTWKSG